MTDRDAFATDAPSPEVEAADLWDPARPDGPVGPWSSTGPGGTSELWGLDPGGSTEPWDPARPDRSAGPSDLGRAGGLRLSHSPWHREHRWSGIAGYAAVAAAAAIGGALVGGRRAMAGRWSPSPGSSTSR